MLSDNFTSIQPGGGFFPALEKLWGKFRRCYLKTFRRGYVKRMQEKRQGDATGAPHPILDPRDLKYCRNQVDCYWLPEDNPFLWRRKIPFTHWGAAELMGYSLLFATATALLAIFLPLYWKLTALAPFALLLVMVNFYRDPPRKVNVTSNGLISPADGKVIDITPLDQLEGNEFAEYLGEPGVAIGIFLSPLNVHINRAPCKMQTVSLTYNPGKFVAANNPNAVALNENTVIRGKRLLNDEAGTEAQKIVLRQVSGALARRIVCDMKIGEVFEQGEQIGMIKLGSRTELILPTKDLEILVKIGDTVKAGLTLMAKYNE